MLPLGHICSAGAGLGAPLGLSDGTALALADGPQSGVVPGPVGCASAMEPANRTIAVMLAVPNSFVREYDIVQPPVWTPDPPDPEFAHKG